MKQGVYNIALFTGGDIRRELVRCEKVRSEALKRCYKMPGYVRLSLPEKNKVYDKVRDEVIAEYLEVEK